MGQQDLRVERLTYCYPDAQSPTLANIDWTVERGEFVLLVGPSGCGKSTLLRALNGLVPEFYGGTVSGAVHYRGRAISEFANRQIARHIGMVFQDPEKQLVMSEVEREVAFGLENLQVPESEMRRRVAEVMSFFDLTPWRHKRTHELSGGEKQKVAIASVMALQPEVLLLDEPTSQLDPAAAQEVLDLIKRLHEEFGLTVVLVEQRLDRVLHLADRIVAMESGRIAYDGTPEGFAEYAGSQQPELLPPVTRLFAEAGRSERPLTVPGARQAVWRMAQERMQAEKPNSFEKPEPVGKGERFVQRFKHLFTGGHKGEGVPLLEARGVHFAYAAQDMASSTNGKTAHGVKEVLKGLDLAICQGQLTAILGANGAGKSTLLRHFCALVKPQAGQVLFKNQDTARLEPPDLAGQIGYLSQNPSDYLFHETLWEECRFSQQLIGLSSHDTEAERTIEEVLASLGLLKYKDRNPRDLSGGERQRAALATVLVQKPQVLLLDEPTRGLDSGQKASLGIWLRDYIDQGGTVVLITHDMEFAAEQADQVVLLDDGVVVASGTPQEMLTRGLFYATQIGRVLRGVADDVVTVAEGVAVLKSLGQAHVEMVADMPINGLANATAEAHADKLATASAKGGDSL